MRQNIHLFFRKLRSEALYGLVYCKGVNGIILITSLRSVTARSFYGAIENT